MKPKRLRFAGPLLLVVLLASCSSWEKHVYQTLAASKATIDQAAADYNAGTLPQTQAVHDIILKAQLAQSDAVRAFQAYAALKVAAQVPANIAAQQQATIQAVAAVVQLVTDIKQLYISKGASNGSANHSPPVHD